VLLSIIIPHHRILEMLTVMEEMMIQMILRGVMVEVIMVVMVVVTVLLTVILVEVMVDHWESDNDKDNTDKANLAVAINKLAKSVNRPSKSKSKACEPDKIDLIQTQSHHVISVTIE
jgi:hypothetical protein